MNRRPMLISFLTAMAIYAGLFIVLSIIIGYSEVNLLNGIDIAGLLRRDLLQTAAQADLYELKTFLLHNLATSLKICYAITVVFSALWLGIGLVFRPTHPGQVRRSRIWWLFLPLIDFFASLGSVYTYYSSGERFLELRLLPITASLMSLFTTILFIIVCMIATEPKFRPAVPFATR